MAILQFLYGKNLKQINPTFTPGTVYLDTETGEMWFDDPSNTLTTHAKVIDTATLIYSIEETFEFPGEGSSIPEIPSGNTSAKLGIAILGSMVLGQE